MTRDPRTDPRPGDVIRLIPRVWELPQCGAQRSNKYANDTPETDRRCKHSGKFEIDGVALCQKHAQETALRILLERTATIISRGPDE